MRYSTREHGSCTLCLSCVGANKVPGKAWRSSEGPVLWHHRRPGTYWSVASSTKPQPLYKGAYAQAYWDIPVYGEYQDLRANRIDAWIINHQEKKVIAIEMSCPWVSNRQKKTSEKTMKYTPLRWELKQKYTGYEISQYNIIVDVLGGWSADVEVAVKELVGRRHRDVLKKMQRACLPVTLNIARTFKVATH